MSEDIQKAVQEICQAADNDRTRMMDIVREVQQRFGGISPDAVDAIATVVEVPRVEVESVVSFYAFFSSDAHGQIVIRVCNDIIDRMQGVRAVAEALTDELGIQFGQTTPDGKITLQWTPCIGMSDQGPAALVGDVVVTQLDGDRARQMVRQLQQHMDPKQLVTRLGDGNNGDPLVHAMVQNNLRQAGPVLFSPVNRGEALRKMLGMTPAEVIRAVKTSRLRGLGGAGFPCGMKWEFARAATGKRKYVICNADEGEPGTFKDRVLLTERADRVFAGMTIAGYAIGADQGIMYLRGEYSYLLPFLLDVLQKRRDDNLLGKDVAGRKKLNFDIRIQMGAGAYVCGEETALITSCEGLRGDPKNRPPFPAQQGYLDCPTVVNNCETLCCVTKILEEGPATFSEFGTEQSSGTKLLSVSGDCMKPGVYEVEFGITLRQVLELVGAKDAVAVQVGGPSGQLVGPDQYDLKICFDDLATGGSIMVFGANRDLLEIVHAFMEFFVDESCGYCTPCRVGNVLLKKGIERLMAGRGEPGDLAQFERIGAMMKAASRCGLGQTSWKPVLTSMENFRSEYDRKVQDDPDGFRRSFDLKQAVALSEDLIGRLSVHTPEPQGRTN